MLKDQIIKWDNLRDLTSAVLQDVYLFNVSIRENIRLGMPGDTDAQVEGATKAAYAHDFIRGLPQGYDTVTGERGFQLIGGQRQRIAIHSGNPCRYALDQVLSM